MTWFVKTYSNQRFWFFPVKAFFRKCRFSWKKWLQIFSCVSGLQKEFPILCLVKTRVSNSNCQKDTLNSLTVSGNFLFLQKSFFIFLWKHFFLENRTNSLFFFKDFSSLPSTGKSWDSAKWVESSEMTEETFPHRNYNSGACVKFREKQKGLAGK